MSFDSLGADLLQQPLLSTQTIPELAEEQPTHTHEITVQRTVVLTQSNNMPNKMVTQAVPEPALKMSNGGVVHVKNQFDTPKPKVQIVKRIPSNFVQIKDANGTVKLNQAVISENMISNTPIVINKVNGNISGTD